MKSRLDQAPMETDALARSGFVTIRHSPNGRGALMGYQRLFAGPGLRQPPGIWRGLLARLEPRPGQGLLDLACGESGCREAAQALGLDLVSLDFSTAALERARRRCPAGACVAADAQGLPFADRSFDHVLCFGSLEHVDHPPLALAEVHRVLLPGGRVLLQLPNTYGLRWNLGHAWRFGRPCDDGQPIQRYGTRGQWRRLIETAGLQVRQVWGYEDGSRLQRRRDWLAIPRHPSRLMVPLAAHLPPDLAMAFVFLCFKPRDGRQR